MAKLFRKKSIERLNDPERLDQVFRIVSPLNWVILIVLCVLIATGIFWAFLGTISTHVQGNGILVSHGQQIYDAFARVDGRIEQVNVQIGDKVKKGQPLVKLDLPVKEIELENKTQELANIKSQLKGLGSFVERDIQLEKKYLSTLLTNWKKDLENANNQVKYLKQAIESREKLVGRGTISQQEFSDLKGRYYKELQSRDAIANKMTQKKIEVERFIEKDKERLRLLKNKYLQASNELEALKRQLKMSRYVLSPVDGHVIEVIAKAGSVVRQGQRLVDIEGQAEIIDAAVYVNASEGKKVKAGMAANIVPTTVKKQEFGSIKGTVTQVARFPSTQAGMMGILANEQLVKSFSQSGPQIFLRVDLKEANTASGYAWTSSEGPDIEISNGTLCTVDIAVKTQAPITLIIPALKGLIGVN